VSIIFLNLNLRLSLDTISTYWDTGRYVCAMIVFIGTGSKEWRCCIISKGR
jgi:hypothetical protein